MIVGIVSAAIVACISTLVSAECLDSGKYSGTLNVTLNGYTCQRWDSQYPHEHGRNISNYFPNDDSVYDAHNYCRDAGGNYELWCYTTDIWQRWDYCVSPNETCQIRTDVPIACRDLHYPNHETSKDCRNETIFYKCKDGPDEDFYMVNILYDLECWEYTCCRYLLPTTTEAETSSSLTSSTSDNDYTAQTPIGNTTDVDVGTTELMSKCNCWQSSVYIYLFVLLRSVAMSV